MELNRLDLTVFVISIGGETFDACVSALKKQECDGVFNVAFIVNKRPMSAAFQEMLTRCKTRYFIQLDEDMILEETAVQTMYDAAISLDDKEAFAVFPLWDVHLDRWLQGVKIYDHNIVRNYPYENTISCEVGQFKRLEADGYTFKNIPYGGRESCVGLHGTSYTTITAYERYKDLVEKHRRHGLVRWVDEYYQIFFNRMEQNFNPIAAASFAGMVIGNITDVNENTGEKDYTKYGSLPGVRGILDNLDVLDFSFHNKWPRQFITDIMDLSGLPYTEDNINRVMSKLGAPREAVLFMTDRCNSRCWFCRREEHTEEVTGFKDLEPQHVERFLRKFPSITGACLAGMGEPLLNENVFDIIRLLKSKGKFVSLITNGILLHKHADSLVESGLDNISVSLNAYDADGHNMVTRTKTFEVVLAGIEAVKGQIKTGVSCVVNKQNYTEIPAFIGFANGLGVAFITFMNTLPHFEMSPLDSRAFRDVAIFDTDTEQIEEIEGYKNLPGAELVTVWPTPIDTTMRVHNCKSPFVAARCAAKYDWVLTGLCRRIAPPQDIHRIDTPASPYNIEAFNELRYSVLSKQPQESCKHCFGRVIG